jgi:ribosomal protein S18 acetylase RimI-like enzyme
MSDRTRVLTEAEITAALDESWEEYWGYYAKHNPSAWCKYWGETCAISFGIAHPLFNQVMCTSDAITPAEVAEITTTMNARGLPWMWVGKPKGEGDRLSPLLLEQGLVEIFSLPGMVIDVLETPLTPNPPDELEICEVKNAKGVQAYNDAILPAYEMPLEYGAYFSEVHDLHGYYPSFPMRAFYGVWEGNAVAGSVVFFGEKVAVIQCVGTREEARGRGFARAVVSTCVEAAQKEGYRYVVLQASDMGFPIYQKMGFRTVYEQGIFMDLPPNAA